MSLEVGEGLNVWEGVRGELSSSGAGEGFGRVRSEGYYTYTDLLILRLLVPHLPVGFHCATNEWRRE